nr:unnamed protein product [Callosobruchus chinensis]
MSSRGKQILALVQLQQQCDPPHHVATAESSEKLPLTEDEEAPTLDNYEDDEDEYIPNSMIEGSSTDDENEERKIASNTENTENQPSATVSSDQVIGEKKKQKVFLIKEKISKKRTKHENEWKKKKAAIARAKGESYISYNGVQRVARNPDSGILCGDSCRLKCNKKFMHDDIQRIFQEFYRLDVNAKNALLFKSIAMCPVARIRKQAKKHKSHSYKYSVKLKGQDIIVCKTAFCKLYQIGRRKVEVIINKIKKGESAPSADKRGCHSNRPHKLKQEVVDRIIAHIRKFPAESSHYSRTANPHKLYLSPVLNMSIMYRLYLEECTNEKLPQEYFVKKSSYANIFNTKFNLSFRKPKSDVCSTCETGSSDSEHKENAETAFKQQQIDRQRARTDPAVCYLTMDLQQTMPLPKLIVSKAFYLRQLWFYNFGIHAITSQTEIPYMQTWTEDVAGRSSSEIASCLWNFMTTCTSVKDKKHLIVWSDSCAGQNKNINILTLYQLMISKNVVKTIDHKFPEVGHTFLDSDRDFGRIEKVLRRHETLYTPQQYREIIANASKRNCHVNNMENQFYDLDSLTDRLGLVYRKKDLLNESVPFRNIKWLCVDEFGYYLFKETYDENTPFKKVCMLKNKLRTDPCTDVNLHHLEEKRGKVSEEKLDNLRTQLQYVPEEHRWFYNQILSGYDQHTSTSKKTKKRRAV